MTHRGAIFENPRQNFCNVPSIFKAVFAMPTEKMGTGAIHQPRRQQRTAAFVDEPLNALVIVHLSRDQNIEIIRQTDQAAIKHPVRGSG